MITGIHEMYRVVLLSKKYFEYQMFYQTSSVWKVQITEVELTVDRSIYYTYIYWKCVYPEQDDEIILSILITYHISVMRPLFSTLNELIDPTGCAQFNLNFPNCFLILKFSLGEAE